MDWKEFFSINVSKIEHGGPRPYFHSQLNVRTDLPLEEILLSRFDVWNLTPSESKRFNMDLRKILHNLHFFGGPEFDRIFKNFCELLQNDKDHEIRFLTQGGGIYLFLSLMKNRELLSNKIIYCETAEIPLPVVRIPLRKSSQVRLIYSPHSPGHFTAFPSLWSRPEIIQLFDKREWDTDDVA